MFSFDDGCALAGLDLALLDYRGTIVRFADSHSDTHRSHPDANVTSAFAAGMASPMLAAKIAANFIDCSSKNRPLRTNAPITCGFRETESPSSGVWRGTNSALKRLRGAGS